MMHAAVDAVRRGDDGCVARSRQRPRLWKITSAFGVHATAAEYPLNRGADASWVGNDGLTPIQAAKGTERPN
jgi:hypothetical protein